MGECRQFWIMVFVVLSQFSLFASLSVDMKEESSQNSFCIWKEQEEIVVSFITIKWYHIFTKMHSKFSLNIMVRKMGGFGSGRERQKLTLWGKHELRLRGRSGRIISERKTGQPTVTNRLEVKKMKIKQLEYYCSTDLDAAFTEILLPGPDHWTIIY